MRQFPIGSLCFDTDESADRLRQDYDIVANAKIMLIVKDACEVSIHRSEKHIIKTDSEDRAKEAADKIYELLR